MNYVNEFTKFITGQYLTKGLRVTVGAVVPAMVLYQLGYLSVGIALPLGALMVSLTDSPGPIHHRRNGMAASNILNFLVAVIIGFTRNYPWLLAIELTLLCFILTFIGVYGSRMNAIGLIAIIVIILNIDVRHTQDRVINDALFMLAGGTWYMLLSLLLYSLRPYRLVQQALGESIILTASYLKTKSKLYKTGVVVDQVYEELLPLQIGIHHQQEELRELLFKTRSFVRESTGRSRILMVMFIDSVDLFEQVMTSQQDYRALHDCFKDGKMMEAFRHLILEVANELEKTGLVIQSGFPPRVTSRVGDAIKEAEAGFVAYRSDHLEPATIDCFISLRHILNSIKDVAEHLRRLQTYASYSSEPGSPSTGEVDTNRFVSHQEMQLKLLAENFSLRSNIFRHSLRISICVLAGYMIAQFLPFGHSYWILLTIVTILKPAYSISKRRNIERLSGTVAGAIAGFILLYFVADDAVLFVFMVLTMIIGYSFLQIRYVVSVVAITMYVLLFLHFLHPTEFGNIAKDRVIDTAIGSAISFFAALFFLPKWEKDQVHEYLLKMLTANLDYFSTVAQAFYTAAPKIGDYKFRRKEAYVALANLSDVFQRLLSEPGRTAQLQLLHRFVVSSHVLTSHIATLGTYSQSLAPRYHSDAFKPVTGSVVFEMQKGVSLYSGEAQTATVSSDKGFSRIRAEIQHLLTQRIADLNAEHESPDVRKHLSAFKTITVQFELIYGLTLDINKMLRKMRGGNSVA